MSIKITYVDDHRIDPRAAVTRRLGLKFWKWCADVALARRPIPGRRLPMAMMYVWGWRRGEPALTEAEDFYTTVEADTIGEAVAKLEQAIIDHLDAQDAEIREYYIENIDFQRDGLAVVVWSI